MGHRTQLYMLHTWVTTVLLKLYNDFLLSFWIYYWLRNSASFDLPISARMTLLTVSIDFMPEIVILILMLSLISRSLNFHPEPEICPTSMFVGGPHVSVMV